MAMLIPCLATVLLISSPSARATPHEFDDEAEAFIKVIDEAGDPLGSVDVFVLRATDLLSTFPRDFATGTTDDNGRLELIVRSGVTLRFDAAILLQPGMPPRTATALVDDFRPGSSLDIELVLRRPERKSATFVFLDEQTGVPIPAAQLIELQQDIHYEWNPGTGPSQFGYSLYQRRIFEADPGGVLSVAIVTLSSRDQGATFRVSAPGFLETLVKWSGQHTLQAPPIEVYLEREVSMRVFVSDPPDGAELRWTRQVANSDLQCKHLLPTQGREIDLKSVELDDGSFELSGLSSTGVTSLEVREGGVIRGVHRFPAKDKDAARDRLVVDLWDQGRITGTLTTRTGRPFEDCAVWLERVVEGGDSKSGREAITEVESERVTGEAGSFAFDRLRQGSYVVRFQGAEARRPLHVASGLCAPLFAEVSMSEPVAIVQQVAVPELITRGELFDVSGVPIRATIVGFASGDGRPFFGRDLNEIEGSFTTPPLPPGRVILSYKAELPPGGDLQWASLRTRVDAGARNACIHLAPLVEVTGETVREGSGASCTATVVLQDVDSGLQRYPAMEDLATFRFPDATAGDYLLWAFRTDGLFADPIRVEAREDVQPRAAKLRLKQGARVVLDASQIDCHLRCDIRLPSGESLERILHGESPAITLPAGPVTVALEEIDGKWRKSLSFDLQPGQTTTATLVP